VGGGSPAERHHYCDRCGAYAYDDTGEPVPDGIDQAANRAAWDEGDDASPGAVEEAEVHS